MWRWLFAGVHNIQKEHRPHLLRLFQSVVYSKTSDEFDAAREDMENDEIFALYENYHDHLSTSYFGRIETWAIYIRLQENYPTHNTQTNNYIESSFRVTKDLLFNRTKCYNVPDLVQNLLQEESGYYANKLIDFGNGIFSKNVTKSKYSGDVTISREDIVEIFTDRIFYVKSQSDDEIFYMVDMRSGVCECRVGRSKAPCKHKHSIKTHFNIAEFSSLPLDAKSRAMWHFIAEGCFEKSHWYRGDGDTETVDIQQHISDHTQSNDAVEQNENEGDYEDINEDDNDDNYEDINEDEDDNDDNDDNYENGNVNEDDNDDNNEEHLNHDSGGEVEALENDFNSEWDDFINIVDQSRVILRNCWNDENLRTAFIKFKQKYKDPL